MCIRAVCIVYIGLCYLIRYDEISSVHCEIWEIFAVEKMGWDNNNENDLIDLFTAIVPVVWLWTMVLSMTKQVSSDLSHLIERLIELEEAFIKAMTRGIQVYSRPLSFHLLTSTEHAAIFQNIEKVCARLLFELLVFYYTWLWFVT